MKLVREFNYSKENLKTFLNWCEISKNLRNQTLYVFKQTLREENKFLNYYDFDKCMKETKNLEQEINYYLLPKAQVAQQVLRKLDSDLNSYYKALKDWKKNPSKYTGKPHFPKYSKEKYNQSVFTNQACQIKNGWLVFTKKIKIKLPKNCIELLNDYEFNQVIINPVKNHTDFVEIHIIYEKDEKEIKTNKKVLAIDLGVDNLASCVDTDGHAFIYSGKIIKSKNQYFNKEKARLQSKRTKIQGKKKGSRASKKEIILSTKRTHFINDYFHKITKQIINFCLKNKIKTVVVGNNSGWKKQSNMGKKNNQTFVSIPFEIFKKQLEYKCELNGIDFIRQEEAYTSKCDSLAFEEIKKHEKYLGKRVERGLFQSSTNKLINADINGALNILRKSNVVSDSSLKKKIGNSGWLLQPCKIENIFNTNHHFQSHLQNKNY